MIYSIANDLGLAERVYADVVKMGVTRDEDLIWKLHRLHNELEDGARGTVIAIGELVAVVPAAVLLEERRVSKLEEYFGDYAFGRYGWIFKDIRPVVPNVPLRGMQAAPFPIGMTDIDRIMENVTYG